MSSTVRVRTGDYGIGQYKARVTYDLDPSTAEWLAAKYPGVTIRDTPYEDDDTPPSFDPKKHGVAEVVAYLVEADPDERARVLSVEQLGRNRPGIVTWKPEPVEPTD